VATSIYVPRHTDLRVSVLATTGRDAVLICDVLRRMGIYCEGRKNVAEVCDDIANHFGAAVIAEESLSNGTVETLQQELGNQPPWSDFPVVLLTLSGIVSPKSELRKRVRQPLGNLILLERPVRPESLLSAVEAALRSRARQYQVRDQLEAIRKAEVALRNSERLATAGRLSATIAHEINNPLEAVTNLLYLAQTNLDNPEKVRSYLKTAADELKRVAHITRQTLVYHRGNTRAAEISAGAVVDEVLGLFSNKISRKNLSVKVSVDPAFRFRGHSGELIQVLSNLIGNAIDASDYDGHLVVAGERHNGVIEFTVQDNGCGIPPQNLERVFEPFFTTKSDVGTGLGLWVTRELVEKQGGSLRMSSSVEPGASGTTFVVRLPDHGVGGTGKTA
jgi:signal transduction histidine kinase